MATSRYPKNFQFNLSLSVWEEMIIGPATLTTYNYFYHAYFVFIARQIWRNASIIFNDLTER